MKEQLNEQLNEQFNKSSEQFEKCDKECIYLFLNYCLSYTTKKPHIYVLDNGGICIGWFEQFYPSFEVTFWTTYTSVHILDGQFIDDYYEENKSCQTILQKIQLIAKKYFTHYVVTRGPSQIAKK